MEKLEQYAGYDKLDVVHTPQFTRRKNKNALNEKARRYNLGKNYTENYQL